MMMLPDFFFFVLIALLSRPRAGLATLYSFFRVGNQYAECEKQHLTFYCLYTQAPIPVWFDDTIIDIIISTITVFMFGMRWMRNPV